MGSGTDLDIKQTLVMVKLAISNKIHNKSNNIFNAQGLQIVMAVGIININSQGQIYMVAT